MGVKPPLRVALLADPSEPLFEGAAAPATALAYDLAAALAEHVEGTGDLRVELFAARGSVSGLPLVSLDLEELPSTTGDDLADHARREALLTQLVLSGMLEGYAVIHCLAPVVTPLQVLAATGAALVQTLVAGADHPSAQLLPRLVAPSRLRRVAPVAAPAAAQAPWRRTTTGKTEGRATTDLGDIAGDPEPLAVGVDLARYAPAVTASEEPLAWCGAGGDEGLALARATARHLGLGLVTLDDGDGPEILRQARALIHPDPAATPCGAVWPLRALACGTPTLALAGSGLEALLGGGPEGGPEAGSGDRTFAGSVVSEAGAEAFAAAVEALSPRARGLERLRARALGHHNRRAMAARYRELYSELASGRR